MCFNIRLKICLNLSLWSASCGSNNLVLSHHISSQFNEDMQDVNTTHDHGRPVEQQVANAIHALLDRWFAVHVYQEQYG